MKRENLYPIRYVARQTGLSTHVIRVWEKRYQAIVPERTDTNRRVFSDEDIKRLQMLKLAVRVGHSISQIANLSSEELMQLIGFNGSDVSWDSPALEQSSLDGNGFYDRSLTAVLKFDAAGLESVLDRAAVHLTKPELIGTVIVPLCQKIGELWKKGKLKVINEHMATTVIQAFLWNLLRTAESAQTSPKIVVATPAGHQHELGALAIALIACESGWRSLYFGPSLPAEEIAAAAALANARAVALSITYCNDDHQLNLEVKKLQRYLGGDITLFVGGQAAAASVDFVDLPGMQIVEDVGTFRIALDTLRVTRHG